MENKFTSIGGQAVIEGVMMRSPHFIAVAVRRANQKIIIRNMPYRGWAERIPFLRKPILRGIVTLLESLFQGVDALSYSAGISAEVADGDSDQQEELSSWAIAGSLMFAFAMAIVLFVVVPHTLTALLTSHTKLTADTPWFHLIDGGLKMLILLGYVYAIALMKDIYRVFQYHGAEHKSIYTFERGEDLTVENARKHSTLHPRCGTSFLLFLVLISVVAFSIIFPVFGLTHFSTIPVVNHGLMILVKIALMLPVAGLAYEFIKACACRMDNPLFRLMIWPGLVLQKFTTREPTDEQLEVALASLRQVLRLEKGVPVPSRGDENDDPNEFEISHLGELSLVQAQVAEFPEA